MRRFPSSWMSTVGKLGFRRQLRGAKRGGAGRARRPRFESLESRELLAITTVTTLIDQNDGIAVGGVSLRDALAHAATLTGPDVIDFDPALNGGTIALTQGELWIGSDVEIAGPGASQLTINAQGNSRVVQVGIVNATIRGLTISGGKLTGAAHGAGIFVGGNLTLDSCVVAGNTGAELGGGIYASWPATLRVINSTIDSNSAVWGGGVAGLFNDGERLYISGSTISHNTAVGGAGVMFKGLGTTSTGTIINSTLSGNVANDSAGIRATDAGALTIVNSTVTDNRATTNQGGGIMRLGTVSVALHNTILADNFAFNGFPDIHTFGVPVTSNSANNLIGDASNSGITHGNLGNVVIGVIGDPGLTPLGDFGGPTKTHALLSSSAAIDAGDNTKAVYNGQGLARDQRGFARIIHPEAASLSGGMVDIGAFEVSTIRDFDGDGRGDHAAFDSATGNVTVYLGSSRLSIGSGWGQFPAGTWDTFRVGDFNGDGRYDLAARNGGTWHFAISESTRFNMLQSIVSVSWNWVETQVGDFDGNGSQELLGWSPSLSRWQIVRYSDRAGATLLDNLGTAVHTYVAAGGTLHVGDADRDGRDDLVVRDAPSGNWMVGRSRNTGTDTFLQENWKNWFTPYANPDGTRVDTDAPIQRVVDIFSEVYNTIDLEFSTGLMKGPTATAETKAGNPWEQATLLTERLEAAGFESWIVTGERRASVADTMAWLGAKDPQSALNILNSVFDASVAVNSTDQTFTFQHAWSTVEGPGLFGFHELHLDPSWKFRNLQPGVPLGPGGGSGLLTTFDTFAKEFLFTKADGKFVRSQLPIEAYEDKVADHLAGNSSLQSNSLADVSYDGAIIQRQFHQIPATSAAQTFGAGVELLYGTDGWSQDYATLALNLNHAPRWAHQIELKIITAAQSYVHLPLISVPFHGLEPIRIWYSTNPIDGKLTPHLSIGNQPAAQLTPIAPNTDVRIEVKHIGPNAYEDILDSLLQKTDSYTRKPGEIVLLSLDANQYSSGRIAAMQASVNDAMLSIDGGDIDDVLEYVGAKYWYNYNRDARSLAGLTYMVDVQPRVGSGLITSKSIYAIHPHLDIPLVPDGMFVDLPNWVSDKIPISVQGDPIGALQSVGRMTAFNASSLENAILEEVINSESISTVKGIQIFLDNGEATSISTESVIVVERNPSDPVFNPGGSVRYKFTTIVNQSGLNDNISNYISESQLQTYLSNLPASVFQQVVQNLNISNALNRVWVPDGKTEIPPSGAAPGWSGTVYIAESIGSQIKLQYLIQPDGSGPGNGAHVFDSVKPQSQTLLPGSFVNQTFAGDPVNVANGNMFRDEVDFRFPNGNLPLDFARHYDSQNPMDVGFGVGWVHSFTGILYADPQTPTEMTWLRGDGQRHTFKFENNVWKVPATLFGQFKPPSAENGNRFQYLEKDGTQYLFEYFEVPFRADGIANDNPAADDHNVVIKARLTEINYRGTDGDNIIIAYVNATSVRVALATDAHTLQRRVEIAYGANNSPVTVKKVVSGSFEATWTYSFDTSFPTDATWPGFTNRRLIKVTSPIDQYVTTPAETQYEYYSDGPLARRGLIKKIIEPNGQQWHRYEYYSNGRVFRVIDPTSEQSFNYNLFRSMTEFTDERGNVETYIHQENGLLNRQIHPDRSRMQFLWGNKVTHPHEEFLMKESIDELGSKEIFTYYQPNDPNYRAGELKQSTSKDGIATTYEYWVSPNTFFKYISEPSIITSVASGATPLVTEFVRETHRGHAITVRDAEGHETDSEYFDYAPTTSAHLRGRLKSQTQPKGVLGGEAVDWKPLTQFFTITGDTLSVRLKTGNDPSRHVVADAIRIDRINNDGVFTRIVDNSTASGTEPHFRFAAAGTVGEASGHTQVEYGGDALVLSGSGTPGSATWIFTDLLPGTYRISATWIHSSTAEDDAAYEFYNGLPTGIPNQTSGPINQQQQPAGFHSYQTVFQYDTAGNTTSAVTEGLNAGQQGYDNSGNIVYATGATGVVTFAPHDVLGRIRSSATYGGGLATPVGTKIYQYDASGLLLSSTDALGRPTTHLYDAKGNPIVTWHADASAVVHTYDAIGNCIAITDELGQTTRFVYDNRNRLIQTIYADGSSTRSRHDGAGRVVATTDELGRTTTFTYDKAGRQLTSEQALQYGGSSVPVIESSSYDKFGRLITSVDPNGTKTSYANDKLGRVVETRVHDSTNPNLAPVALTRTEYDANGHVESQTAYDTTIAGVPIDFRNHEIQIYVGNATDPSHAAAVEDDGRTLLLNHNGKVAIELNFNVNAKTVLEFDFSSFSALYHGIAVGNSLTDVPAKGFLLGPANAAPFETWILDYRHHGQQSTFKILLGKYLAPGNYKYLIFTDASSDPNASGLYSNVRIYDSKVDDVDFATTTVHNFVNSGSGTATFTDGGRRLAFAGDTNKAVALNYAVTPNTVIEFDFKAQTSGGGLRGFGLAHDLSSASAIARLSGQPEHSDFPQAAFIPSGTFSGFQFLGGRWHYRIPIGQYVAAGFYEYLVFINNNTTGDGEFSDVRLYESEAPNHEQQSADVFSQTATFKYDAFGRNVETTNADDTTTSSIYDAAGRLRYTFDELRRKSELRYDVYGRLERSIAADPDGAGSAVSPYTRYVRDAFGNIREAWQFYGQFEGQPNVEHRNVYFYDSRNRVVTTLETDVEHRTEVQFDMAGRVIATVDAVKSAAYSKLDERGRVDEERFADPDGSGGQLVPVTKHSYDPVGNRVATTDPLGTKTEFEYDSLNRLRKESSPETVVADDSNVIADVEFSVTSGSFHTQNAPTWGQDATIVAVPATSPTTQYADWRFNNLAAGNYRVSIPSVSLMSSPQTSIQILNASLTPIIPAVPMSAQVKTADFETVHGNTTFGWHWLRAANSSVYEIAVEDGNSLIVRMAIDAAYPTQSFWADAVRIDRVVSRSLEYDKNGNLTRAIDTRGFFTDYGYDGLNRRTSVTVDPDRVKNLQTGAVTDGSQPPLITSSKYDGYGNLTRFIENRGTATAADDRIDVFQYDKRNRLEKETVNSTGLTAEQLVTEYEYDAVGNQTLAIDPLGDETHYRYDSLNRVIDEYQDFGDGRPEQAKTFNQSSIVTQSGFTGTATVSPGPSGGSALTLTGSTWIYAPISPVQIDFRTVLEFNLQIDKPADRIAIGFDDNLTFNLPGDDKRWFELGGRLNFNGFFTPEFRQNLPLGEPVRVHIPIGQYLNASEKPGLTINHLVFFVVTDGTPEPADVSQIVFSEVRLYQSDEVRTVTTYDTRGHVETVRTASDPRAITTRFEYDRVGQRTREVYNSGGPLEQVHGFAYDLTGNLKEERNDSADTKTVHQYDRLGRLIKTTLPDPDANSATLNELVTKFTYDPAGNVVQHVHGEKPLWPGSTVMVPMETTRTAYDAQGRAVSEWDGNGDETRYRYDSEGNVQAVIDAEQNVTRYTYDGLNRETTETIRALVGTTPTELVRTTEYDAAGNVSKLIGRDGRRRQFFYDTLDRVKQENWNSAPFPPNGNTNLERIITFERDQLGRVTREIDFGVNSGFEFPNGQVVSVVVHDDVVSTYQYDGLGRLIQQTNYNPDNLNQGGGTHPAALHIPDIRQTYDYVFEHEAGAWRDRVYRIEYLADGTPIGKTQYQVDELGRLRNIFDSDASSSAGPVVAAKNLHFGVNLADELVVIRHSANFSGSAYQNEFDTNLVYDEASRVTSITHDLATDIVHTYGYDNQSRITSFNTGATARGYVYDNAGQLTNVTGGFHLESFEYDDNGNRVLRGSYNYTSPVHTVGLANRLTSDGAYSYDYDKEGNIVRRTPVSTPSSTNPVTVYGYDQRNRLTKLRQYASVAHADAGQNSIQSIDYTYDLAGQRVKRTLDGVGSQPATNESFVYDGDNLALRFGNSGELTHRYQYGPAVDQVLMDEVFIAGTGGQRISDEVLWPLGDQQGTIRDVVDDTIVQRKHVDYDSFGRITGESYYAKNGAAIGATHAEAVDQHFAYTGQERDGATGLQYHSDGQREGRWYDPLTGRWTSEDRAFAPNLYPYVKSGVTYRTDPSGWRQAGNPLDNLFGRPTVALPTSLLNQPSLFGNRAAPARPTSTGASLGTVASILGNSVYNAASNYVAQSARTAASVGASLAAFIPTIAQQPAPATNDRYIRNVVPGVPIVPREFHELPIRVQVANRQPENHVIMSHQGQGYNDLNLRNGSVKFINDSEVLPISTLYQQSRNEGRAAAQRAGALTLAQEGLIMISPLHETARDAGIAGFGYDYAEPLQSFRIDDRANAAFLLLMPGGNSGQVHRGNEVLETINEYQRFGIRERGPRLGQQQGREFRTEQLELLEFDPNTPSHVRGWLANERRRVESGLPGPATPPGYELSHGRSTPAREGYDYTNSRLQGIDLNRLEETVRRQQGRK